MNTEISRYLVDANGNSFSSDTDLQSLSNNSKVKNTNSGVSYKKVPGTTSGVPVFDKVPFQEGQPDAVLYSQQSLTSAQKQQARTNIGASSDDAVLYSQQTLTSSQKEQARANIGAIDLATGKGNFVSTSSSQSFDVNSLIRIAKNIGIYPQGMSHSDYRIFLGDYQILFGTSLLRQGLYMDLVWQYPFTSAVTTIVSPLISISDDNAVCGLVAGTAGPRGCVIGSGSADNNSRVHYVSFGKRFKYNQLGTQDYSNGGQLDITESGSYSISINKSLFDAMGGSSANVLVDMFISRDAPSTDYVTLDGDNSETLTTIENTSNPYSRGYGIDLGRYDNDPYPDFDRDMTFLGYSDVSEGKLFRNSTYKQFKMKTVVSTATNLEDLSNPVVRFSFSVNLSSGKKARIRIVFPSV